MQSCLSPKYFQNLDKKSIINITQNESNNWLHDRDKLICSKDLFFKILGQKYMSNSKTKG